MLFTLQVSAAENPYQAHGFIGPIIYADDRGFATIRLRSDIELPYNLEYFQFVNLNLNYDLPNFYNYYTEQNLYHKTFDKQGLDLAAQYVSLPGNHNDTLRLGSRIRVTDIPKFKKFFEALNVKFLWISIFPYQINDSEAYDFSFEHFYRIEPLPKLFKNRVYLQGFIDQDLQMGNAVSRPNTIVSEHRLGVRVYKNFYTVAEIRYDGSRTKDQVGVGIGLEYFYNF